jgi:class 3 adenylate cyclase
MPALSFRLKLLLAMMLVVGGVSFATLLVTQRSVQDNYERMFRRQFERQLAYFTSLQDARLSPLKEMALTLCQDARFIVAMRHEPVPTNFLYSITNEELRTLRMSVFEGARQTRSRVSSTTMFRFLDARGRLIQPPPEERARAMFGLANPRRSEQQLSLVRGAMDSPEPQQVGYLAVNTDTNRLEGPRAKTPAARPPSSTNETSAPVLQEIILTRIVDPENNHTLGALLLGFPLPELVPQAKTEAATNAVEAEPLQSGILLGERLYASTNIMSDSLAAAVSAELAQRMGTAAKTRDEFDSVLEGSQYRVFYQLLNSSSALPLAYQVCLYSMEEARHEQKVLFWKIAAAAGGALLVALISSLVLAHGLSVPISDLVEGTREVRAGNFQVKVPVRGRDELGELATSFNEMAEGLAQKEKYRTVLNQVADEKVAKQLISGEITLGGELREVSVLFCDIRGFTPLTENMPPGEVIEMLNEHMTALTQVVRQHNGVLDKFVGDALMAIFGAPVRHGNDALAAAQCALELITTRESLNQLSRFQLRVGVGLATGNVVAGGMGSVERFHYTVLGERVNLASRLCSRAGPGEVLIDQTTFELLRDSIQAEAAQPMQLKGFATAVQVYKLLAAKAVAEEKVGKKMKAKRFLTGENGGNGEDE